jgi:hypothetical protein
VGVFWNPRGYGNAPDLPLRQATGASQMKFRLERIEHDRVFTFSGEVTFSDLENLVLSDFDIALMDDASSGKEVAWSEYLLVLEMIFRKHEEQMRESAK